MLTNEPINILCEAGDQNHLLLPCFFHSITKGRFFCFTSKEFASFFSHKKSPSHGKSRRKDLEHRMKRIGGNKKHRMTIRQNCFRSYSSYGARVDLSALSGPATLTRYKDLIQFSLSLYRSGIHLSTNQKRGACNSLHHNSFL